MKYEIHHIVWIAADRCNKTVSIYVVSGASNPLDGIEAIAPDEHTTFERYPIMDSKDFLCYISDLNHMFMVKTLA